MKKYQKMEKTQKDIVDMAKKEDCTVITNIMGFLTNYEAEMLRDFLLYAHDNGVPVTFAPKTKEELK